MLNPLIFGDFTLVNEQSNERINIFQNDYVSILESGWRNSQTSKHTIILKIKGNDVKYHIISNRSFNGYQLTLNPYYPNYFLNNNNDFLISETGIILDMNGNSLPYFWSRHIESPSLLQLEKDSNLVNKFLNLYIVNNYINSFLSNNYLEIYNDLLTRKTHDKKKIDYFNYLMNNIFIRDSNNLLSSWSHGDLWMRDIFFIGNSNFKIIDWEWFCISAPVGSDILDFLLYGEDNNLLLIFDDFLYLTGRWRQTIYFLDHFPELMSTFTKRCHLLAFFIYRYVTRVIIQDGLFIINNEHYQKMINYSFQLNSLLDTR